MSSACFLFTLLPFLPFPLTLKKQIISTKKLKIAKNNLFFQLINVSLQHKINIKQ